MDPQESRSRSPSLLDSGDQPPVKQQVASRVLPDTYAGPANAEPSVRRNRWLWPIVLLGVALVAFALLRFGNGVDAVPPTVQSTGAVSEMSATGKPDPAARSSSNANSDMRTGDAKAAVILDDDVGGMPALSASTAAVSTEATSGVEDKRAAELGQVFSKHAVRTPVAASPKRVAQTGINHDEDADVDLLTALIKHVEVADASRKGAKSRAAAPKGISDEMINARLQACPAPNTEAGITCRQRICAGRTGLTEACPAALPSGS